MSVSNEELTAFTARLEAAGVEAKDGSLRKTLRQCLLLLERGRNRRKLARDVRGGWFWAEQAANSLYWYANCAAWVYVAWVSSGVLPWVAGFLAVLAGVGALACFLASIGVIRRD